MEATWDREVDAAYIDLSGENEELALRQVQTHAEHGRYEVVLDVSPSGKLLGVEILGASEALDAATLGTFTRIDEPDS